MLKIVFKTCCGIDVHKDFVVSCIAKTDNNNVTTYQSKRFSTFTKGLRELLEWLNSNSCKDVCMESTGKYWHPVFNILEDSCNVIIAHPKYVKAIIAVARMLMTVIYHILQDKVCYDKELYSHYNQLPTSKEITVEQAIALAKRQGYKLVC